jgi:DNA-directed RNA polymerase subunit RPC12/RpoP
MKKKLVEANPPKPIRGKKHICKVQLLEGTILVLNFFKDGQLHSRHCFNTDSSEYATLQQGKWTNNSIDVLLGSGDRYSLWYGYGSIRSHILASIQISKEDTELVLKNVIVSHASDAFNAISQAESEYRFHSNIKKYNSKERRIRELMEQVPDIPNHEEFVTWAFKQGINMHFAMKEPVSKKYFCTSCCGEIEDAAKHRNNDLITCPHCGQTLTLLKHKKTNNQIIPVALVQPIDDEKSVVRHFRIWFTIQGGYQIEASMTEETRLIMYKENDSLKPRYRYTIYYNAYGDWQDTNPQNRKWHQGYLYNAGIDEAFKDTIYEQWTNLFKLMSAAGYKCNFNRLMAWHEDAAVDFAELLYKGRFYRLLQELSERVGYWEGKVYGLLEPVRGLSLEATFEISDKQRINRLRDHNGGYEMLRWMQWSDETGYKISDATLSWVLKNSFVPRDLENFEFTLEQAMNYIERQRRESYKGKSAKVVLEQYTDYIKMAIKLHKDVTDAMIYKPRDLKKYHDEYVLEIERRAAEIKAEEYSEKFSEAEQVLGEIKDKFEYAAGDYFIIVPDRIVDIVTEGAYLHHCVGSTDRYFDRIKQHETYICFMRRSESPEEPFYTIEVEPGGTIRQHRGMFDEEPEIEKVKPFLRKWQKEIKRRMKAEDYDRAAASKVLREENIAELKQKGNTRVLDGLLEDFMEAI